MSHHSVVAPALALLFATVQSSAAPGLALEVERSIVNPSDFDLIDSVHGDLRSMNHCHLRGGAEVSVARDFDTTGDVVTIRKGGADKTIAIPDTVYWGTDLISMDCDREKARWFYGHTVKGTVTAYSVSGAELWKVVLDPFRPIPNERQTSTRAVAGKHAVTALQVKGNYLLVQWSESDVGQYFAVFTTDGKLVEQFGPSTFLLRTAGTSAGWELLWGTSAIYSSFIPLQLYTLRVTNDPIEQDRPGAVLARLKSKVDPGIRIAAKLRTSPLMDHALALLWSPATKDSLDFCPFFPPESAKVWLGSGYDPAVAAQAKRFLLALWSAIDDRYGHSPEGPFNVLFREKGKTDPELARLLAKMTPTDPAWDAAFRPKALAILEGIPETRQLAAEVGKGGTGKK